MFFYLPTLISIMNLMTLPESAFPFRGYGNVARPEHSLASTDATEWTTEGPSANDWDSLRPVIKRLYIDEDRTLNNVISTMARDYGHIGRYDAFALRCAHGFIEAYMCTVSRCTKVD